MGIRLHEGAVHIGARVPLVAVGDDIFLVAVRLAHHLPLEAGGVAGAAPPAQPTVDDLAADRFWGHLAQRVGHGGVAAARHRLLEPFRVDQPAVGEHDLLLLGKKGQVAGQHLGRGWLGRGWLGRGWLGRGWLGVVGDDLPPLFGGDPLVDEFVSCCALDGDERAAAARAHTACGDSLHLGLQMAGFEFSLDGVVDCCAPRGKTRGAGTTEDATTKGALVLQLALGHRFQVRSVHGCLHWWQRGPRRAGQPRKAVAVHGRPSPAASRAPALRRRAPGPVPARMNPDSVRCPG